MSVMTNAQEELEIANEMLQEYANENAQLLFKVRNLTALLTRAQRRGAESVEVPEQEAPDES